MYDIYRHIHLCESFTDCLICCILSNGDVIMYHVFISLVVTCIELKFQLDVLLEESFIEISILYFPFANTTRAAS